ncbi:glycosyltransferase family 4 protein [Chloroflexota bacterium]
MRVLFVTGEFPPMEGGVGDYTREIGLALRDLGCQVHVLSSDQAGPVPGLTVYPSIDRWNWSSWGAILDQIHEDLPDVVHTQYQAAAYAMHPAINLLPWRLQRLGDDRPRSVVTFHDLKVPYLFPKAGLLRRWVVNELARRSDAAITTNREDFNSLERGLDKAPALIPIGSNIAPQVPAGYDRDAWRARWGVGPEDLLLCFFGFVNDRKGVETLLHALELLASGSHNSAGVRLLFIGGQTGASDPTNVAYLAKIQSLIVDLGLEDRVLWTGYVPADQVTASFKSSDLCVLPYRDGVSFLHGTFHAALAHGLPILTSEPRVSLPELVDGTNVALVPAEQPRALAEAITALAANVELRLTLATGAQALSKLFTWDRIAAATLDLYRSLGAAA